MVSTQVKGQIGFPFIIKCVASFCTVSPVKAKPWWVGT